MKKIVEMLFYITVGAGVAFGTSSFTMLSEMFQVSDGVWIVVAICSAGIFCILISTAIGELASLYPAAPGIRTYLKTSLGQRTSLLLVYLYLASMVLVAGVESYLFALVVRSALPHTKPLGVVLALLFLTIAVNLVGLTLPRVVQMIATILLIGTVVALGFHGAGGNPLSVERAHPLPVAGHLQSLPASIGMAVYLFVGFEWVTMLGFNAKAYEWKIPLSMPLGILANMVTYSGFALGLANCLPRDTIAHSSVPQVPFFVALLGPCGIYTALILSILTIIVTFNAGLMGGARLIHLLAVEGVLPRICKKISLRTGSPAGGIWTLGLLASAAAVAIVTFEIEKLVAIIASTIVCFVYSAFMIAVIRQRKKRPEAHRTFRTAVPVWALWIIAATMPFLGILSLLSEPGKSLQTVGTALLLVMLALVAVRWTMRSKQQVNAMTVSN